MARQKILVVDDDPQLQRLLMRVLNWKGYQVIGATSGEEGVDKVRDHEPDLVLMDVMMPGMNGFEATRRIRRLPQGRHIPIIFLSALDDTTAQVKGLRVGGDDYITKPVRMGELLARIEARLRPESLALGQSINLFGGRSGVGTTTLAVNLAVALRRVSQKNILLVDWQRPLGDVALFFGLPEVRILELLLPSVNDLDEEVFASSLKECWPGVQVLLGVTDPLFSKQMDPEALNSVLSLALAEADYVLVDEGSFFSWQDPPLVNKGEGINLVVLTPELTSIKWTARAMEAISVEDYEFWLLLNRDGMSGGMPREQIESRLGTAIRGCIPDESDQVVQAMNEGRPLYTTDSSSGFSRAIEEIATRIHDALTL